MENNLISVGIGELHACDSPGILTSLGLGSCIGIVLYDPITKVGGLAHIMLPSSKLVKDSSNRGKFADTATIDLLELMLKLGARKDRIFAKLAGGAHMFAMESDILKIGERNIKASKEALEGLNIPIRAHDVGGTTGRTIKFNTDTGIVNIRTAFNDIMNI